MLAVSKSRGNVLSMCCTCETVRRMGVMIQVRNVPRELHEELKVRAASRGLTLTDYIQRVLEREVARPAEEEVRERLGRARRVKLDPSAAEIIRRERDER